VPGGGGFGDMGEFPVGGDPVEQITVWGVWLERNGGLAYLDILRVAIC